ncbi:hypothetical protein LJR129_005012 [Acidovorax sp. LjRoot129]|uniref:hypothetical protein n=1 Tax=unclassified Acidovorax TaxID=2684926 RepID=UPI003ED0F8B2
MDQPKYGSGADGPAESSVLSQILGVAQLSRLERVQRATRVRELTTRLCNLLPAMGEDERASFAELVGLVRQEHVAACDAQHGAMEAESAQETLATVRLELEKLREANAKMHVIALSMQSSHAQGREAEKPRSSPVAILTNWIKRFQSNKG